MDTQRLAVSPVLAGVPEDELKLVSRMASELEIAEGKALTTEGEFGHTLFLIESGTGEVSVDGNIVGSVGPGDVVGEIAVLASGRRTASVIATSPMRVIGLFKRDVWALEQDAPETSRRLREALGAHLGTA
jgi:CRP/FNR family cyclic AMP-dependent transcriptional regulator